MLRDRSWTDTHAGKDDRSTARSDRSALSVAPHLYQSIPYDPAKDLAPVTLAAHAPTMLVAHPSIPASTAGEFLAYAKRQEQDIQFASAGLGTNNHIAMELLKQAAGIRAVPVHYKGGVRRSRPS
jgi:tripartite-type tricarboxylate transporter receptor subunit TctC